MKDLLHLIKLDLDLSSDIHPSEWQIMTVEKKFINESETFSNQCVEDNDILFLFPKNKKSLLEIKDYSKASTTPLSNYSI